MANVVINAPPATAVAVAPWPVVWAGSTTAVPPEPTPEPRQPDPGYEPDDHVEFTAFGYGQENGHTVIAVPADGANLVSPTSAQLLEVGYAGIVMAMVLVIAVQRLTRRMRARGPR